MSKNVGRAMNLVIRAHGVHMYMNADRGMIPIFRATTYYRPMLLDGKGL